MYDENDYCNFVDIKGIENQLMSYTNILRFNLNISISAYNQMFYDKGFFFIEDVEYIENRIDDLGNYFYKPYGWIKKREYSLSKKENFSYKDINRWINNLSLFSNALENTNVTIWNYQSFENWNNDDVTLEWEE